jgi:hypothetical protein
MRMMFEEEIMPLNERKGHDYSGKEDSMANMRDFGFLGIVIRLGDKWHRLKNFAKTGHLKVEDEKIEDTLKDMINYAFFALMFSREEKSEKNVIRKANH